MNLLYVCTHNRCRSILCEALTNALADPDYRAASAGSAPSGEVHPKSLEHLQARGIGVSTLNSKSWHDLGDFTPDVVITVCDSANGEACPLWLSDTLRIHWGLSDPSKCDGSEQQIDAAFNQCIAIIQHRLEAMRSAQLAKLPRQQWPAAFAALSADISNQGSN